VAIGTAQSAEPHITLRPATVADAERLYRWRMDPVTRASSLNSTAIEFEGHCAWLVNSLADADRQIYIAEHLGIPFGTVRADRVEDVWRLSWTIAPEFRGRGLGARMVQLFASSMHGAIEAVIKSGNRASIRIAEAAGMQIDNEEDGVLRFSRGPIRRPDA
jgi:RimJ/RimL family protein N-acetyltransferase